MTGINNIERNRAIVDEYRAGRKQIDIAKDFNISRQRVNIIIDKYNDRFGNPIYEKLLETNSTHVADREFERYKNNPALIDELLRNEKQVDEFKKNKTSEEYKKTKYRIQREERKTQIWENVLNEYDTLTKDEK